MFYERIFLIYIYCNNENLIWNTCNYCRIPSKMRHSFSLISFSHKYQHICTWHGNFLDVFSFSAVWSILCVFRRNRAPWSFKVVSHSINDSDIHRVAQMSSVRHTVVIQRVNTMMVSKSTVVLEYSWPSFSPYLFNIYNSCYH